MQTKTSTKPIVTKLNLSVTAVPAKPGLYFNKV